MPRNSVVGLTDSLNMTIVVDRDVKPTTNQTKQKHRLLTFFKMTPSFRGVSARKFAEKLRESSRSFSASFRRVSRRDLAKEKWSARAYAKSRGVFSAKVRV